MMLPYPVVLLGLGAFSVSAQSSSTLTAASQFKSGCKCAPTDSCWPTSSAWKALNSTVSGKLFQPVPPAIVCYDGPQEDLAACANVATQLTNSTFVGNNPVALDYPINDTCPAVTSGGPAGSCSIGSSPRYVIDATTPADVAAGVNFARTRGIRLVVRNTGHDLLGRSTGYGSLQVWIRHLRQGITFQKIYVASDKCSKSGWTGSAFKVAGGYVWGEVYSEAAKNNVVVVGGGDPSVGCIGGWAQGGGHSPANHYGGLGADQILEAQVVMANGQLVTANACQNTDLYFAIRGGGGGTWGVVVSTSIKAHPQTAVSAQVLAMAPLTDANISEFMEALEILYSSYPTLNDGGFNGYGSWMVQSYAPVVGNSTTGYNHALAIMGKSISDAQALFGPVAAKLAPYNGTSLSITTTYYSFPTYASYYSALSGGQGPVGSEAALGSRLLDRASLTGPGLAQMLNITAGSPGEFTVNNLCLVGGGQVFADAADQNSGVNPGWRTSYVHNIVARGWAPGTSEAEKSAIHADITNVKTQAMKAIAPNTGCYMNEADRFDADYLNDYYGANVANLQNVKAKYDPLMVFYCPTCIGSDNWGEDSTGRLCHT